MTAMMFRVVFMTAVLVVSGWSPILAQGAATNAAAPANAAPAATVREDPRISFLTPAQQDEYAGARAKALTDNPALKLEGEKLMPEYTTVMAKGSAEDKQMMHEKVVQHRQKLRQAMLKEDPKLAPIFTEIDNHLSEEKAKSATPPPAPSGH
jgi:hypothetical protein